MKFNSAWKKIQANTCMGQEIQNKLMQTVLGTQKASVLKQPRKNMANERCPLKQERGFSYADFNHPNWNIPGMLRLALRHLINIAVIAQLLMIRSHWSLSFHLFSDIFHTPLIFTADMRHTGLWFRKFLNLVSVGGCSFSQDSREKLNRYCSATF